MLPALVNERPDALVVELCDRSHRGVSEGRELGRSAIILHLRGTFAAGDGARHRWVHQNPAQRKLGHGDAGRNQAP